MAAVKPQKGLMSILEHILRDKTAEVAERRRRLPLAELRRLVQDIPPPRGFLAALRGHGAGSETSARVIAEVKKASPSRGVIRPDFDAVAIAKTYAANGAAALSVLTEPEFFRGSLKNLRDARSTVKVPVLRKDFIFDPWQVWETRANDADSFLLIVGTLSDAQLKELLSLGRELGMEPVVEVHTREELDRAFAVEARIIGVNNRNLKTLEIRTDTSFELIDAIPDECVAISESGIRTHAELLRLRAAGFDAFLIGTRLMISTDPATVLGELLGRAAAQGK